MATCFLKSNLKIIKHGEMVFVEVTYEKRISFLSAADFPVSLVILLHFFYSFNFIESFCNFLCFVYMYMFGSYQETNLGRLDDTEQLEVFIMLMRQIPQNKLL